MEIFYQILKIALLCQILFYLKGWNRCLNFLANLILPLIYLIKLHFPTLAGDNVPEENLEANVIRENRPEANLVPNEANTSDVVEQDKNTAGQGVAGQNIAAEENKNEEILPLRKNNQTNVNSDVNKKDVNNDKMFKLENPSQVQMLKEYKK